jgi:DMATS type aromatic prenyltransferase
MPSYSEISDYLLEQLCYALGLQSQFPEFRTTQAFLLQQFAGVEVPPDPPYASLLGDDHSPFEYSVAFSGEKAELRLLLEVQAPRPEPLANQRAALAFNQKLAARYQASFERFDALRDLFVSDSAPGQFSLWHGARFDRNRPDFKVYLNPETFGAAHSLPLMSEALRRLGLGHVVPTVEAVTRARGGQDALNYFSLDLSQSASARIKVYFRHEGATASEVDRMFTALAPTHRAGDIVNFSRKMVGHDNGFAFKPVTSCLAFTAMAPSPTAMTFHLPIAHYTSSDASSVARSAAYLKDIGQPRAAEKLEQAVRAFAPRSLESGCGVQSYASFRRESSGLRFTAYLSPELFREAHSHGSCSRLRRFEQKKSIGSGSV